MFGLTYLVEGALHYDEPGVFICFEETEEELAANVASLGFDLKQLIAANKLAVDYVRVERSEIEETGEYDLEGLFVRIDYAIKSVGAKRVVLDTIEALFSGLSNMAILRAELRRLFRWLKDQGVTSSSPPSAATARLPATGWKNMSPTASSCSTTASRTRWRRAVCASSNTAAPPMAPTNIRS